MVSIKGKEWRVTLRALCENNRKWWSLRQSLSSAFIASKGSKHSDRWQNVCSGYKTSHKWLRFHSLAVCFFWLLSGWRWKKMTGNLLVLVKTKFMSDYTTSQQCEVETLCILLSCQREQSDYFHYISSTSPSERLLLGARGFHTMTCFCSPALNAGHGFIYPLNKLFRLCLFSDVTLSAKMRSAFSFHCLVFAELWLHLKVMPQVRSHCVRCAASPGSLTASVWDWCFRR